MEAAGKYHFRESLEHVVRGLEGAPGYNLAPLSPEIVLRSRKFRHLETMDRLIVATAEELDCPLITADAAIQDSRPVEVVWD